MWSTDVVHLRCRRARALRAVPSSVCRDAVRRRWQPPRRRGPYRDAAAGLRLRQGARVRSSDPALAPAAIAMPRRQACRVLESLGAIELAHLDDCAVSPGAGVDYVVAVDGDVHALCAFCAYAVPQLRALGWRVEIDPEYPWQVVGAEVPLYAAALPDQRAARLVRARARRRGRWPSRRPAARAARAARQRRRSRRSLTRPSRRCVAVRVDDKRWLPVPPARLQAAREGAASSSIATARKVRAPAIRAPLIAELCATLHDGTRPLRWVGDTKIREQAYALALGPRRTARSTAPAGAAAPSCARTSARASRGCSTCARTTPAASSPTTWASARRCRRSRTC